MENVVSVLLYALDLYALAVVIRVLASWLPNIHGTVFMRYLRDITDPLMVPMGKIIPPVGGIDLSPMAVLFLLWMLEELLRMTLVS